MLITLIALAATTQASSPHWFAIDRPNGTNTYLWGTKDERGYIRGFIPPPGSPELLTVPKARPDPASHGHILNYGVDVSHLNPRDDEVRGTDPALGRELAKSLLKKRPTMTGQCPGPGPCPSPRKPPRPPPNPSPVGPEAYGIRYWPLAAAVGLVGLTGLVCGFAALVAIERRNRT